jgi:alpha-tubulin suppressor-like RCC1 family protein
VTRHSRPSAPRLPAAVAVAALATIAALGSCSADGPTGPAPGPTVASITVLPGADTIVTLGRTRQFAGTPRDAAGNPLDGITLRWRSSDTLVARVDSITGLMTAVAEGSANITAVTGVVTGGATVHIIQFVAGVSITPGTSTLVSVGQQQPFTAVARDSSNAVVNGVRFLWGSSNPGVALVDTLGVARAQASGSVTISATGRGTPGYAELVVNQAATKLAFTVEPTNSVAGAPMNPAIQVEIRDAGGARVTTARNAVTLDFPASSNGATIGGTRTVNAIDGVASFSGIWLDKAFESYQLAALATGIAPDTSAIFAITAGPVARLVPTLSTNYEANVGPAGTLWVNGFDAYENPVTPTDLTATLLVDLARPRLSVQVATTTSPEVGRLDLSGPIFDRPATNVQLRFTAGPVASPAVAVSQPLTVRATPFEISAGNAHACIRATANTFCWGGNFDGQLGEPAAGLSDPSPVPVTGGQGLTQIVAGQSFSCGLNAVGTALCWGGRFGVQDGALPIAGTGPGGAVLTALDAEGFVCGLTAAGEVYCWGENIYGLGDGSSSDTNVPVLVAGTGTPGLEMTRIAVGRQHACALNAVGEARCWGANGSGQLGDSTNTHQVTPILVAGSGAGDRVFGRISAGYEHTCAVNASGAAWCWGSIAFGALGTTGDDFRVPRPVIPDFSLPQNFSSISAGQGFTCGVSSGEVICWGRNHYGQIGIGTFDDQPTQRAVAGVPFANEVVAGSTFACARAAGTVLYCWGDNLSGQVGTGSRESVVHPLPVRVRH